MQEKSAGLSQQSSTGAGTRICYKQGKQQDETRTKFEAKLAKNVSGKFLELTV